MVLILGERSHQPKIPHLAVEVFDSVYSHPNLEEDDFEKKMGEILVGLGSKKVIECYDALNELNILASNLRLTPHLLKTLIGYIIFSLTDVENNRFFLHEDIMTQTLSKLVSNPNVIPGLLKPIADTISQKLNHEKPNLRGHACVGLGSLVLDRHLTVDELKIFIDSINQNLEDKNDYAKLLAMRALGNVALHPNLSAEQQITLFNNISRHIDKYGDTTEARLLCQLALNPNLIDDLLEKLVDTIKPMMNEKSTPIKDPTPKALSRLIFHPRLRPDAQKSFLDYIALRLVDSNSYINSRARAVLRELAPKLTADQLKNLIDKIIPGLNDENPDTDIPFFALEALNTVALASNLSIDLLKNLIDNVIAMLNVQIDYLRDLAVQILHDIALHSANLSADILENLIGQITPFLDLPIVVEYMHQSQHKDIFHQLHQKLLTIQDPNILLSSMTTKLSDPNMFICEVAMETLRNLALRPSLPPYLLQSLMACMTNQLNHTNDEMRQAALEGLGRLALQQNITPNLLQSLMTCMTDQLNDTNHRVRQAALEGLVKITIASIHSGIKDINILRFADTDNQAPSVEAITTQYIFKTLLLEVESALKKMRISPDNDQESYQETPMLTY